MSTFVTVGIDVSKHTLDVAFGESGPIEQFKNTIPGRRALGQMLLKLAPSCIVMEATGGYERAVLEHLQSLPLPVLRINPRQVRDFAKAKGILAKTDALDARVLADFARLLRPQVRPPKSPEIQRLNDLVTRRRQIVESKTREKNHLEQVTSTKIKKTIHAVLETLDEQLDIIEKEIAATIKEHDRLKRSMDILTSVPGIGNTTAAVLVAQMPELGQVSRQAIAALAGLAPFNNDSGMSSGKRAIRGGRAQVRATLYMATLTAARVNPVIREDVKRLVDGGKPAKVALTAGMRKLLTIANALIRDDYMWGEKETSKRPTQP